MWILIIILAIVAIAAIYWGVIKARAEARLKYEMLVAEIISDNIDSLHTKYKQTLYKNEHGHYKFDKWFEAVDAFIDGIMCLNKIIRMEFYLNPTSRHLIKYQTIPDAVAKYGENTQDSLPTPEPEEIIEKKESGEKKTAATFEEHCANILKEAGWIAKVTPGSIAAKGIDVIATYNGGKLILRCLVSDKPVGDFAVNEIVNGRQDEETNFAGVVSNQPFTTAAKQQAQSTKVLLLNPKELPTLAGKLGLM